MILDWTAPLKHDLVGFTFLLRIDIHGCVGSMIEGIVSSKWLLIAPARPWPALPTSIKGEEFGGKIHQQTWQFVADRSWNGTTDNLSHFYHSRWAKVLELRVEVWSSWPTEKMTADWWSYLISLKWTTVWREASDNFWASFFSFKRAFSFSQSRDENENSFLSVLWLCVSARLEHKNSFLSRASDKAGLTFSKFLYFVFVFQIF